MWCCRTDETLLDFDSADSDEFELFGSNNNNTENAVSASKKMPSVALCDDYTGDNDGEQWESLAPLKSANSSNGTAAVKKTSSASIDSAISSGGRSNNTVSSSTTTASAPLPPPPPLISNGFRRHHPGDGGGDSTAATTTDGYAPTNRNNVNGTTTASKSRSLQSLDWSAGVGTTTAAAPATLLTLLPVSGASGGGDANKHPLQRMPSPLCAGSGGGVSGHHYYSYASIGAHHHTWRGGQALLSPRHTSMMRLGGSGGGLITAVAALSAQNLADVREETSSHNGERAREAIIPIA